METESQIISDYIRSEVGYKGELTSDIDLLEKHILDSFSVVHLALFVQEQFEIELEAEDLVHENFASLAAILALIDQKRGVGKQ